MAYCSSPDPLPNNEATLTYSGCPPTGQGDVETATYHGDEYNNWGSGSVTQVVNASSTTTTVKSSKNPVDLGQAVTFSVVVKAPWAHVVDGTVTFSSGSTTVGTITLTNSRGSLTVSSLPAGQNAITATYTPSNQCKPSGPALAFATCIWLINA
jgi:Bacterial Ig-like domain (group 3)